MFDFVLPESWLAFVVALIATQVLGFLWYRNMLFARPCLKPVGMTVKQLRA